MPIVLTPIGQPVDLPCPHCGAALLRVEPKASHTPPGEYWCLDADTVPIFSRLTEAQRDMAFTTELGAPRSFVPQHTLRKAEGFWIEAVGA